MLDPAAEGQRSIANLDSPPAEALAHAAGYRLLVELPGVGMEDIEVTAHVGHLTVRGRKRPDSDRDAETWFFCERRFGPFDRRFHLPEDADLEGMTVVMNGGVLRIDLPRRGGGQGLPAPDSLILRD